MNVKVVLVIKL